MSEDQLNIGALTPIDIEEDLKKSFMAYAMAVIVSRALPDVARRPQARASAHPLFDDGTGRDPGQALPQERPHPSATAWVNTTPMATVPSTTPWCAWRRISPPAARWWRARATSAPWTATARRPCVTPRRAFQAFHGDGARSRQGNGGFLPQLRRDADAARRAARALPKPAGQRLAGHRRGHGHQHTAAQPRRGH